ncbi:MAG: family efflux transporter permease subunit [Marmoricola sp.]|nr:family efflux transporter permease subunit [Marmoricola sp.]
MAHNAPASAGGTKTSAGDIAVLRWLVGATFIVILNETILVNALPHLQAEFGVGERTSQWLTTAFLLTMAVVIPVTGFFLQRVTTRQAFGLAMAVFCTGTLLAALAPTSMFWVLVVARVIQASGTAVMMPLLMTTLMSVVPENDRGRVMGNVTLAMSVAPAMGPAVSGVILQYLSWRWMFGLVLPIAALIAIAGLSRLKNIGEPTPGSIDVPSVIASALGFGGLVYGLSLIGGKHQPVPPAVLIVAGLLVVALFVVRQLRLQRKDAPLLDLRTLKHRTFTLSVALMVFAFMGFLGSLVLLPFYLQNGRGLSILHTGLLMMPGGLAMGLLGPQVGKVFDRVGGRPLVIPGSIGILVGMTLFTQVGADTPYWQIIATHVLVMVSLACVFTPVFTLGLGAVPPNLYSHASSLLGALQQVAGAVGSAISLTILASYIAGIHATSSAFTPSLINGVDRAFVVIAGLSAVVVVLAIVLPGRLPAGSDPDVGPMLEVGELLGEAEAVV